MSHLEEKREERSSLKDRLDIGVYLLVNEFLDRGLVVNGGVSDDRIKGNPDCGIRDTISVDVLVGAHCVSNEGMGIRDRDRASYRETVDLSPRRDIASVSHTKTSTTKHSKHVSST